METEFPVNGIKVIFFVGEFDPEIATQNVSHLVEAFQSAVIIDDSFGAA